MVCFFFLSQLYYFFSLNRIILTEDLSPTPHYNSVILRDLVMSRSNLENVKIIKEYPNLRDGIILLKIWLAQRDLTKGFESFNGYVITMFVLYLLSIKKLNTFMSSYQIVRNVWSYLGKIFSRQSVKMYISLVMIINILCFTSAT